MPLDILKAQQLLGQMRKERTPIISVVPPPSSPKPREPGLILPIDTENTDTDTEADAYLWRLTQVSSPIDEPQRDLGTEIFKDGVMLALLFNNYKDKHKWPIIERKAIQQIILDLDWMFLPDSEAYVYNFCDLAFTLKVDADHVRDKTLQNLGLTYPKVVSWVYRGRLWLKHVKAYNKLNFRVTSRAKELPVPTEKEAIMAAGTHRVDVVRVSLSPHPNADTLSVVKLWNGGYTVVVKTDEWKDKAFGAYIPPDSMVPATPEYAFLKSRRVTARKIRGVWSMGLLVPAPENSLLGDDVSIQLGITHYEPPERTTTDDEEVAPPPGVYPKYDVEPFRKYHMGFKPGELVWVTEKIHGMSARWVCVEGQMYAGTKRRWIKEGKRTSLPWKVLNIYPQIETFCRSRPYVAVYGEIYGYVQDLHYGAKSPKDYKVAVFDIWKHGVWLDANDAFNIGDNAGLPWVPIVESCMPFDFEKVLSMADGMSRVPGAAHLREGIVIKPVIERWDERIGRICLKIVSNQYLSRTK